ncbi:MAG: EamA family transporter [Candidatus Bathyarchaeota archaeon]|nr:EamA family transporter [Candidatus Bathyarchaeota archaeon]
MDWVIFGLLAPAFWALNNVFLKFLLTKKFSSQAATVLFVLSLDTIFALAIFLLFPVQFVFPYSLFGFAAGALPFLALWFYAKALQAEEVSRLVPLFQLIPVFVAVFSAAFLDEILGPQKYLGIALIVGSAMLVSYRKTGTGGKLFGGFKFMILFTLLIATYNVTDKFLLSYLDVWSLFSFAILGSFCGVLSLLASSRKLRKEFTSNVKALEKKTFAVALVGESFYILGTACSLLAFSLVDVSLAAALTGLQPFFVFFYMLFLSTFLPHILKEETTKTAIALKTLAIIAVFIGTWLIV